MSVIQALKKETDVSETFTTLKWVYIVWITEYEIYLLMMMYTVLLR